MPLMRNHEIALCEPAMTEESEPKEPIKGRFNVNRSAEPQVERPEEQQRTIEALRELAKTLASAVDALRSQNAPRLDEPIDFYEEVRRFEIGLIQRALKETGGNQAQAARLLSLNQPTLHGKIKQYQIAPDILLFRDRVRDDDVEP